MCSSFVLFQKIIRRSRDFNYTLLSPTKNESRDKRVTFLEQNKIGAGGIKPGPKIIQL